ncbi:MAG: hypothetical protein ABL966_17010 [Acidimicrobiales bacterium]
MLRAKAAASVAAFVAVVAVVGTFTYVTARDEPSPATTTTTTTRAPTAEEVADAVASALSDGLGVALVDTEARCVALGLLGTVGQDRLEELADTGGGEVTDLTAEEQDSLVRTIVLCVPSDKAAGLLSPGPTTTIVVQLPDEGVVEP